MMLFDQLETFFMIGLALVPGLVALVALFIAWTLRRKTARAGSRKSWLKIACIGTLVAGSFLPAVLMVIYVLEPTGVVVYDDIQLTGDGRIIGGGEYRRLVVGTSSTSLWAINDEELTPQNLIPIPDIFLRLPNGKTLLLREITPEQAATYWERSAPGEPAKSSRVSFQGRYGDPLECILVFEGDRLIAAYIDGYEMSVGTKEDGPFYQIPLTYRQMVELFGKPRYIFQRTGI